MEPLDEPSPDEVERVQGDREEPPEDERVHDPGADVPGAQDAALADELGQDPRPPLSPTVETGAGFCGSQEREA